MSPEQKCIAIAEAMTFDSGYHVDNCGMRICPLPFISDLNAMHEARKHLTKLEKLRYQEALYYSMHNAGKYDGGFASWHYIDAGAAEHADAFLVAKGLLK